MGRVRGNDRRVLVFGVPEIAGHPIGVQQVRQLADIFGVEPTCDQRADIIAILGAELGARCRVGGMMAARLALQHLSPVNVVGDCRLGRQRAGLVDRRIDILALPGDCAIDESALMIAMKAK